MFWDVYARTMRRRIKARQFFFPRLSLFPPLSPARSGLWLRWSVEARLAGGGRFAFEGVYAQIPRSRAKIFEYGHCVSDLGLIWVMYFYIVFRADDVI